MQIIKLDATESTNVYLKELMGAISTPDFTIVVAADQRKGRGQMGTTWESEAGKNLTFSVLKILDDFKVDRQFELNICVSLAVYHALRYHQIPDLYIKWPNDILSGDKKIGGILIENILSGPLLLSSVIGIGLNVNQISFGELNRVSSLKLLTGRQFDLDGLLNILLDHLQHYLGELKKMSIDGLWEEYEKILFRKDRPSTFQGLDGSHFPGIIKGVSPKGTLLVAIGDGELREFGLKEVTLLY
ncbi:MAG: biotin--[acetyl-CoA-carboxylase] ligase [Sediminicola sp.]|tara:strand:+ start:110481 stop:111212 length:732 start_codon:yes stop_codon:yes gene_type:complete